VQGLLLEQREGAHKRPFFLRSGAGPGPARRTVAVSEFLGRKSRALWLVIVWRNATLFARMHQVAVHISIE
jgi:hypothetical protein